MTPEFWHQRWSEGRIGFHRSTVNPSLLQHADRLGPAPRRVLVPLCGKSLDLLWLVEQGHTVTGVELSRSAADALFAGAGLVPEVSEQGAHTVLKSPGLTFIVGDFFTAPLGTFDAIWDRAALIALPPELRTRYAGRIRALLAPGGRMLLSCLVHDLARLGPPHSVSDDEVRAHYAGSGALQLLADEGRLHEEPRWQQAGMTVLQEKLWLLQR